MDRCNYVSVISNFQKMKWIVVTWQRQTVIVVVSTVILNNSVLTTTS